MNPIISRIHSGDLVSIIVFWSPNIMMMYFIPPPPRSGTLSGRRHPSVGAARRLSTSGPENLVVASPIRPPRPGSGVCAVSVPSDPAAIPEDRERSEHRRDDRHPDHGVDERP